LKLHIRNITKSTVLATAVDVADTSSKRNTGLLKHKSLPHGEGLLIFPSQGIHTVGMKFPIDVLFLNRSRKVLKIRSSMVPFRISLCLRAESVLELPAGTAADTGTAPGDLLEFDKYE
jgi:hypothetical protein